MGMKIREIALMKGKQREIALIKGSLPEGFFDNKDADVRASGVQFPIDTM